MGVEPPEPRSAPRNRKCGNCRFYEPAPLWRKGWCRNPKLYPPHANHLVDATTIDCEGGFRSRIYWEALPETQASPEVSSAAQMPLLQRFKSPPAEKPAPELRPPLVMKAVPPLRPEPPKPLEASYRLLEPGQDEPLPPGIGPGKDWRAFLREKAPFTQTWPLENLNFTPRMLTFVGLAGIVILLLLVMIIGNAGKSAEQDALASVAAVTQAAASVRANSQATLTALAPTPTPTPPPTPTRVPGKSALVRGTDAVPLNLREEASLKGKLVTTIKEGEQVSILDGPKEADGRSWYKIAYKGSTGWAVKDYLEIQ